MTVPRTRWDGSCDSHREDWAERNSRRCRDADLEMFPSYLAHRTVGALWPSLPRGDQHGPVSPHPPQDHSPRLHPCDSVGFESPFLLSEALFPLCRHPVNPLRDEMMSGRLLPVTQRTHLPEGESSQCAGPALDRHVHGDRLSCLGRFQAEVGRW